MLVTNQSKVLLSNTHGSLKHLFLNGKWQHTYDGVARANEAILLAKSPDVKDMTDAEKTQVIAEARFLRGHYHFEGKKMWNMIPYIDENTRTSVMIRNSTKVANDKDIWPNIEEISILQLTILPATQSQKGRATKWAAMAYLAKTYMFQKKFSLAKPLLLDILQNSGKEDLWMIIMKTTEIRQTIMLSRFLKFNSLLTMAQQVEMVMVVIT